LCIRVRGRCCLAAVPLGIPTLHTQHDTYRRVLYATSRIKHCCPQHATSHSSRDDTHHTPPYSHTHGSLSTARNHPHLCSILEMALIRYRVGVNDAHTMFNGWREYTQSRAPHREARVRRKSMIEHKSYNYCTVCTLQGPFFLHAVPLTAGPPGVGL
jgi:hypothetical protein